MAKMHAAGLLLIAGLLGNTVSADDSGKENCPEIAQKSRHFSKVHGNTCYLFVDSERYWNDARSECWEMGGEMLSVRDASTMNFIKSTLNSKELGWYKNGVWLGARFISHRWKWTSGVDVEYTYWAANEPSMTLGFMSVEDCALMRRDDDWRWHDYICGSLRYHYNFICEFPVKDSKHATKTPVQTSTTTVSTTTRSTLLTKLGLSSMRPSYLIPRGDGSFILWDDRGQESHSMVLDHSAQGGVANYPFKLHPAFNLNGHHQAQSAAPVDNGNMTILTIILVTGSITLLILLLVFLIVRKRYNYKKAVSAEPAVLFENNQHIHNSYHQEPLPPPPAPHRSYPVRPVASNSDLYLTPVEVGVDDGEEAGGYEEVREPNGVMYAQILKKGTSNASLNSSSHSEEALLGACGGFPPGNDAEDGATVPLVSAEEGQASLGQSEESLHSMSSSLAMKTSTTVHNDYVDMNGSPVAPARLAHAHDSIPKVYSGNGCVQGQAQSEEQEEKPLDPGPDYSNLMSASQRSENLYEQLR